MGDIEKLMKDCFSDKSPSSKPYIIFLFSNAWYGLIAHNKDKIDNILSFTN